MIKLIVFLLFLSAYQMETDPDTTTIARPDPVKVSTEILGQRSISLFGNALMHFGDVDGAERPYFDDSGWTFTGNAFYDVDTLDDDWDEITWHRFHLKVDSTMYNREVALFLFSHSASTLFINGEEFYQKGNPSRIEGEYETGGTRIWTNMRFSDSPEQVIAVRTYNPQARTFKKMNFWTGLNINLNTIERTVGGVIENYRFWASLQWLFATFYLVFGLIHILLFLFNTRLLFNFWFALICFFYSFVAFGQHEWYFFSDLLTMIYLQKSIQFSYAVVFISLVFFLNSIQNRKPGKFIITFAVFGLIFSSLNFVLNHNVVSFSILGLALIFAGEAIRLSYLAIRKNSEGSWIVGGGVILFVLSVLLTVVLEFSGYQPTNFGLSYYQIPYATFGIALLGMSVYQSKHLSLLNIRLLNRLEEVKKLSEENLDHERSIREAEIQRARLETENQRKTKELEKARELQLSLLPAILPQKENWEIGASMLTATEVGGDYYDFVWNDDGSLLCAVGDATGHGTDAGFLAAMTKTLFLSTTPGMKSDDALREMSAIIKSVGLKNRFVCLSILKINESSVEYCSAGIPQAYVVRHGDGSVEPLLSKGMPLGTTLDYPYQTLNSSLETGDFVLVYSDGLIEQMNEDREQFGDVRLEGLLGTLAGKNPRDIIDAIQKQIEDWRGNEPLQDDITIVCLKKVK